MNEKTTGKAFEGCMRQIFNSERECLVAPKNEVQLGEVVLGTLENDIAKALYSVWQEMEYNLKIYVDGLPKKMPKNKVEEINAINIQHHKICNRIECIKGLFWEIIYTHFPKSRLPGIEVGIRQDWKVVIFKSSPTIIELLMAEDPL